MPELPDITVYIDGLGARLGGIGIGFAGGLGVLVLTWGLGMPIPSDQLVTYLPWDVIMIIASVICAIACMQLAGGMDYLVHLAEKALRKNPKHITFAAPVVTAITSTAPLWCCAASRSPR